MVDKKALVNTSGSETSEAESHLKQYNIRGYIMKWVKVNYVSKRKLKKRLM